jgi:hypothetical protein
MTQTRNSGAIIAIGFIVLATLGAMILLSADRHPEAGMVRSLHQDGICEGVELYFSPPRGTVLVLCGIPDSADWGGLIYRVTENYGHTIIAEPYEVTVFVGTRHYWDNVLSRDEYLPLGMFPNIERVARGLW